MTATACDERLEKAQLLLEWGADVNARDGDGNTALMVAAEYASAGQAKLLLKWDADVHIRNADGNTALMIAAYYGHSEMVSLLLGAGADVNAVNHAGKTALQWVRDIQEEGSLEGDEAVIALLKQGSAKDCTF
jgi:ankyrin repeat protein